MIFGLFRRSANRKVIERLHGEIVDAARNRSLFTEYAIEDSFEGRFESIALHASLVLRRLNAMAAPAPAMAQDLADAQFRHFEIALREMGIGDVSVPKRMKTLAEAFLGRAAAYDQALRAGAPALMAALARNVYCDHENPGRLARYVGAMNLALEKAPLESFAAGPVPFPEPSTIV